MEFRMKIMISIGTNFCQVDSTRQRVQDRLLITGGNQKWHGAIPNLIISPRSMKMQEVFCPVNIIGKKK